MIFSVIKRHLALKISLLLLPLLIVGLALFSYLLIQSRMQIIEESNFQKARTAALVGAQATEHFLEGMVNSGVLSRKEIFDRDYQPIREGDLAGTLIPKYHTAYDRYLDESIRHLQDAFLSDPNIIFAVLVDVNGYLPTHNSKYSQPLTGDTDRDRVDNRTKRIFDDPVGLAAARFEGTDGQPVLRQTYHRDTGVTMWDVSAPVMVFGRHWGGFRIGLSMEKTEASILYLKRTVSYGALVLGFLMVIFTLVVITRATLPLKQLTVAAAAIAEGRRQKLIDLDSQDEIGKLVNSFNQMQLALERTTVSRDYFDRIINSIHDLLLVVAADGSLLQINQAVKNVLGVDEKTLLGQNISTLFIDKTGGSYWYKQLSQVQRLEAEDVFLSDAEGAARAMSLSASPLYDEHSQIDGYIIVCQDNSRRITAEQEMEKAFDRAFALNAELREVNDSIAGKNLELDEAYQQLKASQLQILQQEKMASIGQLAAGVAHEINNPIGFITSNLKTLGKYLDRLNLFIDEQKIRLHEKLTADELQQLQDHHQKLKVDYLIEDGRDLIEESLDGAGRVKAIVQNLKSFSRLDQAEVSEINLNECLESTISIAWNELKYKAVIEKDFGLLAPLHCHPQQLNQVFLNILVNAAHAIENQGIVGVRTWQDDHNQYVVISDNGSGIPDEVRHKIFEPFFTTKKAGNGTGLGMSISYDIIKSHGGQIEFESQLGVGTAFTIVIPRQAAEDAQEVGHG